MRSRLFRMMQLMTALLILLLSVPAQSARAAFCRNLNGHSICIVEIKRSAKYYWKYRAVVQIDGIARPLELYNCRDRTYTRKDGKVVRFEPDDPGDLICTLMQR